MGLVVPKIMIHSKYYVGIIFVLLLLPACATQDPGGADPALLPEPDVRVVAKSTPTSLPPTEILPTESAATQVPANTMGFGMESHRANFQDHDALLGEPGLTLMRHNGLLWQSVEPLEGERDWTALAELDQKLERASASGLSAILIVRGTPEWAQQFPGSFCGPIRPDKLQNYADFVHSVVERYSQPPV